MRLTKNLLALLIVFPFINSCGLRGPGRVSSSRLGYNEAVAQSSNEQLLLNIVRLHYRDSPVFLELSQIITSYSYDYNAGANGSIPGGGASKTLFSAGNVSGGARYSEKPTLTFKPLTGEEFTQKMLTPLSAESLFMLADAGWDSRRLMMCCIQEINGLRNLPTSLDSGLRSPGSFERFKSTADLLSKMQSAGYLKLVLAKSSADNKRTMVHLPPSDSKKEQSRAIRGALNLDSGEENFPLYNRSWSGTRNEISIKGRSLLGTLQFLSRFVGQPESHTKKGLADDTKDEVTALAGDLLSVSVSDSKPDSAFTSIHYRDLWYYIADNDKRSKSTFGLLTQLLSLQAKAGSQTSSFLTIPVN